MLKKNQKLNHQKSRGHMVIRTYPNTTKQNPGGAEEGVGSVSLQTTTKDNVQVTDAFTVICSDM